MKLHERGSIISDRDGKHRYQIVDFLGRGGVGVTYRSLDLNSSQQVAIKVVSLRQIKDWKVLELFEREAKVLRSLDRQFIPAYLDYFELETEDDKRFYLVQELVEGKSLVDLVADGWHGTEIEIKEIAIQLLDILNYLHSFDPPVIHRDLKPHNIIRGWDGKIYLVDFGAVQDIYRHTVSLSRTFVGTLGYMPLEQLRGEVYPASDLYSLGCTILFLLTHKSPTDLPQKGLSIDFSNRVNVSVHFQAWLARILEPIVEDRFPNAALAQQALRAGSNLKPDRLVASDRLMVNKTKENLRIKIPVGVHYPTSWLDSNTNKAILTLLALAAIPEITVVFILIWFLSCLLGTNKSDPKQAFTQRAAAEKYMAINVNAQTIAIEKSVNLNLARNLIAERQEANTTDFAWANIVGGKGIDYRVEIAVNNQYLNAAPRQYSFGQGYINQTEARWIAREISDFIDQIRN